MARAGAALIVAVASIASADRACAYTASGDRNFAATLVLPQLAPGDEAYFNFNTLPLSSSGPGTANRSYNFNAVYAKTITHDLGIYLEESYTGIGLQGAGTQWGWQNQDMSLKYLVANSLDHEFIMTLGLDREFGNTGAARVGASDSGATTPQLYFGKGLGDLDIGYLRPLAITTFSGLTLADAAPRPDVVSNGFTVEYSIPYLQSKVKSFDVPDIVRNLTPMTEVLFTSPVGRSFGARTTALIAPGVSYAGEGWEFGVEALVPATRATGTGVGIIAQMHIALDFFFPESIGKPLISTSYP